MHLTVSFLQGPEVLSSCGNLSLSGSQSYGSGGRPLIFNWSVTSLNGGDVTDIESVLTNDDSVKINGKLLESGKTYAFKLKVANFLNLSGFEETTHSVTKNSDPVPALTLSSSIDLIDGKVYVSEEFSIKTNAIVSNFMMFTTTAVNPCPIFFLFLLFFLPIHPFFFLFSTFPSPSYASPPCSFFCPLLITQLHNYAFHHQV